MTSTDADSYFWCLTHERVERGDDGCARDQQLGPYPTEDAAKNWKQQFDARNEAWDQADREWEGED